MAVVRKSASQRKASVSSKASPRAKRKVAPKKTVRTQRVATKKQPPRWQLQPWMLKAMRAVAIVMIVVGAVAWLNIWINNPENLRISKVDWQGEIRYQDKVELRDKVEPFVATNLYLLDEVGLEETLESLPWIREASFLKVWPDQLVINLEEQFPVAFWGDDHLMNQFGDVFPADLPEKSGEFPMIYSPKTKGRAMAERYVELMHELRDVGLEIVELVESDNGSLRMKLRDGQDVILGKKEQERRIKRFKVGYVQELKAQFENIRTIDLRYTNGFAIEWKRGSKGGAVSSLGKGTQASIRS